MGLFDELNRIKSIDDEINAGATQETIQRFALRIKQDCGVTLPDDYLEFLSLCDGFDFNGYCIFGTSEESDNYLNMVEANSFFHKNDNLRRYWFFGTSSLSWYVYDKETNCYLDIDASEEIMASFQTFSELAETLITKSIGE